VAGDSHTECAIDESIYERAVNVSQSGTAYLYSYCKVKRFLSENKHIDTVFLSFHYSVLAFNVDSSWIFDESSIKNAIPRFLTLLDKDDIAIFTKKEFSRAALFLPYRLVFKFIIKKGRISYKDLDIGGYVKLDRDKLQEDIAYWNNAQAEAETGIAFYQKEYLLKIVDLCKSRNVKLILINPPTYKPEVYGSIDKLNEYYDTYLSGTTYMDYSAFPLPDSCYGDIGHLNYKGAKIFSTYLQENFDVEAPFSSFPVKATGTPDSATAGRRQAKTLL
jgi:hypothetical protein